MKAVKVRKDDKVSTMIDTALHETPGASALGRSRCSPPNLEHQRCAIPTHHIIM
jgi:hypothetical protein